MGSFQSWFRAAPPARPHASVFAIGRRVYVACAGGRLAHVVLTDDGGADALARLADGTEVAPSGASSSAGSSLSTNSSLPVEREAESQEPPAGVEPAGEFGPG
jgi:hypothetical protein